MTENLMIKSYPKAFKVAAIKRMRNYLLGNHISATTNRRFLLRLSRDFTQCTVTCCTRSAHDGL